MGGRRFSRRCSENTQAAHHRFRSLMRGREVAHGSFSKRLQTRLRHARRVAGALPRARARRRRDGVVTAVVFAVIFIVAGSIPGVRRVCQAFFRAGVPNFHRSGIEEAGTEEAGCMKRPAGKNRRPPGGRHSSQILPPGGRRLFCAVGFIPMDEEPSENRCFLPGRPGNQKAAPRKGRLSKRRRTTRRRLTINAGCFRRHRRKKWKKRRLSGLGRRLAARGSGGHKPDAGHRKRHPRGQSRPTGHAPSRRG